MQLFGDDLMIGDFKLSDYGLVLSSFDSGAGSEETELGMDDETIEEFIGHNPVPVYLGHTYSEKLRPTATVIKDPCSNDEDLYFSEHECREILRQLTGFYGYREMIKYSDEYDELLYYNVRVNNISYQKIGGKVAGIIISMECDSQFAWSKEFNYTYNIEPTNGKGVLKFYNTSDVLYDYLKPKLVIKTNKDISKLTIKNLNDDNWTCELKNLSAGEIVTMDCKNETLETSIANKSILDDFNMHFFRFISGINNVEISNDVVIEISFRYPRKVGIL